MFSNFFRRQATLNAIHNCRTKALSIAQFLKQTLGPPILIQEEDIRESVGISPEQNNDIQSNISLQEQLKLRTVHVMTKVFVIFECYNRTKKSAR